MDLNSKNQERLYMGSMPWTAKDVGLSCSSIGQVMSQQIESRSFIILLFVGGYYDMINTSC
jgi:hypothetical protein